MSDKKKTIAKSLKQEPTFTKAGLSNDGSFSVTDRDIINIALDDDKKYTLAEVKQAIKKFKEGI